MARDTYTKVLAIFYNNPSGDFSRGQIVSRILRNDPDAKEGTIDSALHKHRKRGFIRRYRKMGYRRYTYKLDNERKTKLHLDKLLIFPSLGATASIPLPIPDIRKTVHNRRIPIKLEEAQFQRLERYFSVPAEGDRARNRTFVCESFKITVSEISLRGNFYILEPNYVSDVFKYLGRDLADKLLKEPKFIGVSIDADIWAGYRMSKPDLKMVFAHSDFYNELDVEGQEELVNLVLQNITTSGFEAAHWQARMTKLLTEMKETQDSHGKSIDLIGESLTRMLEDFVKSKEPKEEVKEKQFTDRDAVMYS